MKKFIRLGVLAIAIVAMLPGLARAAGAVVGKECRVSWVAPTTNVNGGPITVPLGFKRYDQLTATPVPVPGTAVPVTTLAPPAAGNAPTVDLCGGASPGQHFSWVTAFYATGEESPIGNPVPWLLTLAPPGVPTNVRATVTGSACSLGWTPPTVNADGTTLIGTPTSAPLTYLVYATAAASPAPIPGTTIPLITQAAATLPCGTIPAGSPNVWVAVQNVNGVSAVQPSPLALTAAPTTPSGVTID